jgi:pimeloyl-ACP methyl ester carboxylesterase
MPEVETRVGKVAYDQRGEGPPLILLASGAHTREDFDELRARLPGVRTIAPDWPGHGASPAPSRQLTAMACADAAEDLVAALAPGGAVVLGNSVGGFSAARLAIRRPELVRGLVLVDSGGFLPRTPPLRGFCRAMSSPRFLRTIYPTFGRRYMRAQTDADRAALARAVATARAEPGTSAVTGLWRSFASPEHDLRAEVGSIAAPTLIVWGRRDPVIPLKVGRRLEKEIPGARLVVLDSGHVPQTSDPDGFAAELVPFMDSVLAAAPASGTGE